MTRAVVPREAAKKIFIIAVLILCFYPVKFMLIARPYPLLMYLMAHDSGDTSVVYEKVNQVFSTFSCTADGIVFQLAHSVPNFASYSIRINRKGSWMTWNAQSITLKPAPDGTATLEIKARNRLGGETAVFTYAPDGLACIAPLPLPVSPNSYKFEDWRAPGVNLFQQYTVPVVVGRPLTWDRAMAVFAWATGFLEAGKEQKNPNFQPVVILQERLRNPHSSFLCGSQAAFFIAACHSVGVIARLVHLKRSNGDGHYVAEVWSDQHHKWIAMDPMYKRIFCNGSNCYSVLDLRREYLASRQGKATPLAKTPQEKDYLSLYGEIHYFMSNAFYTSPPTTFRNLVFGSPAVIRWKDAQTSVFNKSNELCRLLLFYYLPRLLDAAIIPAALFVLVYLLAAIRRRSCKTL